MSLCSRSIGLRSCRRGGGADQQGGAEPFWHTTVDPGGNTTVVLAGGGGLLLLKLRHPASNRGRSNAIRRRHMAYFLAMSRGFARARYQVGKCSARVNHDCAEEPGGRANLFSRGKAGRAGRGRFRWLHSLPRCAGEGDCAPVRLGLCYTQSGLHWGAGFSRLPRAPRNTSDGGGGIAQAMPGVSIGTAT